MTDAKTETEWVLDPKPVTIQEWVDVMGALPDKRLVDRDTSKPVVFVTATEADEYARRIDGRLPTDEELERAFCQRAVERIQPVIWEWTSTAAGSSRVIRGGCWFDDSADSLSASSRSGGSPVFRYYDLGLRCARPPKRIERTHANTVVFADLGIEVGIFPVTIRQFREVMGQVPAGNEGRPAYQPITFVTATEADEYARRVGGRLPTDEELRVLQVGERVLAVVPALWEWTSTVDKGLRAYRGGGWYNRPALARASYRSGSEPAFRYEALGFRCVWEML